MARTIRLALRKDKINKQGSCPVAICITIERKRLYHNTGIKVPESAWSGTAVKGNYPNAHTINTFLKSVLSDLEKQVIQKELNKEAVTLKSVKALLHADTGTGDFFAISKKVLSELQNPGTKRRYQHEDNQLKEYSPVLSFADVTPVFLSRYNKHLLAKPLDQNSAINAFKWIRKVFNYAIADGATTLYPFKDWDFPRYKAPPKGYLTMEETERIWEVLSQEVDQTIKTVAAFFLVECYAGIRVSDWGKFSIEKNLVGSNFILRTTKTGTLVQLPIDLMPSLKKVLDYIKENNLIYTETGEHANRILKLIGPLAKISKNLTTHVGRHTFATLWLEKGLSRESISELMGITIRQVDTYAKYTTHKLRSEIARIGGI